MHRFRSHAVNTASAHPMRFIELYRGKALLPSDAACGIHDGQGRLLHDLCVGLENVLRRTRRPP